ncbi:MAG: homoserine O-acetyltransferase [Steroidobacteraceae bacterium]
MAPTRNPERAASDNGSREQRVNGTGVVALPEPFRLYHGGTLQGVQIAYESWGRLNRARDNAILLFTGLSPSAHAAATEQDSSPGWWQRMIGPGLALDTERHCVICVNSLGSCFGSTGPASINPATGARYAVDFPELAIEDIAGAARAALQTLGIERLAAVVGASLGGMSVLAFATQFPDAARRLITISGSGAASPFAIALRSVQREAVLRDPDWQGGHYAPEHPPRSGMRLARKLGTITYRSALELRERFGRELIGGNARPLSQFAPRFAIEGYLEAQAERFVRIFDPNCYLYLSSAMDRFDLAEHGGSFAAALQAVRAQVLVLGVESDLLFAIDEQAAIAAALERNAVPTQFVRLPSLEGHDSFLIDISRFGGELRSFFERT